jgi:preprotein translocase subunit SecA
MSNYVQCTKAMLDRDFRLKNTCFTTRAKLRTMAQKESVSNYANEFRSLFLQMELNLPEDYIVFLFYLPIKGKYR